jgi:hypothetical protein
VTRRLARTAGVICLVLAGGAALLFRDPRVSGGILGGGVLIGLALWSLAGVVNALTVGAEAGDVRRVAPGSAVVRFFARHAILAVAAYVMMVRLHLDPIGMVVGVTSVVAAAAREAARPR